jgi:hypothetical protein
VLVRRNIHIDTEQTRKLNQIYKNSGKTSDAKPASLIRLAIDEFFVNHPEKLSAPAKKK